MKGLIIFGLLSVCLVGVYCGKERRLEVEDKYAKVLGFDSEYNTISRCHVACILKEEGAMQNGVIDVHHKKLPQHPRRNECANLIGKDDCDTAEKYADCIQDLYLDDLMNFWNTCPWC